MPYKVKLLITEWPNLQQLDRIITDGLNNITDSVKKADQATEADKFLNDCLNTWNANNPDRKLKAVVGTTMIFLKYVDFNDIKVIEITKPEHQWGNPE